MIWTGQEAPRRPAKPPTLPEDLVILAALAFGLLAGRLAIGIAAMVANTLASLR